MNKFNDAVSEYDSKNYKTAYSLFLALAEENNLDAQKLVANMLIHGIGISKNEELGYFWYRKAAENSDSEALYWLAMKAFEDEKFEEGTDYLESSAQGNNPNAFLWLGNIFRYGMYSHRKDLNKAQDWLERAAAQKVEGANVSLLETVAEKQGKISALIYSIKNRKLLNY